MELSQSGKNMMSEKQSKKDREEYNTPENWEYIGETGSGNIRFQNDCGLWLVVQGRSVVKWVGNFHFPVKGTGESIGQFESRRAAVDAAQRWMEENPHPWDGSEL